MKVIHLISGGDSGGARTHVHLLLKQLSKDNDVKLVCFMDGFFAQDARELGIDTLIIENPCPRPSASCGRSSSRSASRRTGSRA